ncbi:hypothetical protein LTR91_022384 [Friedmanniomyces endolithicus]|uniref:DUF7918 domain-containing protein n=1 Tax=Friedmanniomyces endolithicus TaxID=329885 RepID=A0AAN6K2I9_9PEZI|nr:hypothetical protein LTR59_010672 [Friedmanniomyces endolithicus]KAK0787008.1 hypothetical protein LTR38_011826 [Friedmanniomyces endolithicus]KAK0799281.1 hypothetical protein LTR75_009261 [Friedmanniomyces endolithicus]KAK0841201.1 hypothetical protein LTR03_010097 [Friedmanniomyces endolithicus]KAK0842214.1 hypothetical protein LTS02_016563 [Friedmanniomyces endolithicus]
MKIATLPGVQVKLRVNGADLQEYADNTDELYTPKIGRQYVEAVSGADFEICFAVEYGAIVSHTQADVVACHIYLDGKWVTAQVLDTSSSAWAHGRADNGRGECRCSIDGRVENVGGLGGQYYKRRFESKSQIVPTFADLATDDRSAKHITPESVASLGEVKVQWIWMRRAGVPRLLTGQSKHTPATGESLPEKCLKGRAISQTAKLGEAKACAAQTSQDATYPYGRQPFATFTFKYRSRRDLQIEGVIARTPSPSPLEDRDPDSLTADEARELVRRMRAQQDEQVRIKREKRARSVPHDDDDRAAVALETRRRKRPRASHDSGIDVVDLTDF